MTFSVISLSHFTQVRACCHTNSNIFSHDDNSFFVVVVVVIILYTCHFRVTIERLFSIPVGVATRRENEDKETAFIFTGTWLSYNLSTHTHKRYTHKKDKVLQFLRAINFNIKNRK